MEFAPSEIVDMIVDHLHDDESSLRACSQLQKRWLPASRYHLFHDIGIHPHNLLKFNSVLESNSYIAPLVRSLKVFGFTSPNIIYALQINQQFPDQGPVTYTVQLFLNQLSSLLGNLVNLDILAISLGNHTVLVPETWHTLTNVREVRFDGACESLHQCLDHVCAFKGLQMVSFNGSWQYFTEDDVQLCPPLPGCMVKEVTLRGDNLEEMTGWLRRQNPLPRVLSYRSNAFDTTTYEARRGFLQTLGQSIPSIVLNVNWFPADSPDAEEAYRQPNPRYMEQFIDLRPCISLKKLTLLNIRTTLFCVRDVQEILSRVTSNRLEDLILQFTLNEDDPSWVDRVNLQEIEHLLQEPRFRGLRQLVFGFQPFDTSPSCGVRPRVEKAIARVMPLCHKAGILKFNHGRAVVNGIFPV